MKKWVVLLTFFSIVSIGCSSDSDRSSLPINEENLLGKWYAKGAKLNTQPYRDYEHDCPASRDYQEILSSHNMKYYTHGTDCEISNITSRAWSLDGNQLTVINPDSIEVAPAVYKISTLTEEELIFRIDYATPTGTQSDKYYYTRN